MSAEPKLYIAGMGMITAVGANTAMTAAAVRAGVSGYAFSDFFGENDARITLASVPDDVFVQIDADIIEGSAFNERQDRVTKMAILAIREACAGHAPAQPIPLLIAMPEGPSDADSLALFAENLGCNCKPWATAANGRRVHHGRAAGIEAIGFIFRYLSESLHDYFLVGASDSYLDYSRLYPLSKADRLRVEGNTDGFVPGEAACFLLLTRRPEQAMVRQGQLIALHVPGIADEVGHLSSQEPYRGDGLADAFRQALVGCAAKGVDAIYSSLNGEHFWGKEYGVAYARHHEYFHDPVKVEHPADCYGDLGSATAPTLIALAAEDLFKYPKSRAHLVYSSSDGPKRGAIVVEKLPA